MRRSFPPQRKRPGSAYTTLRAELAEKVRKASLVNPDDVEPLALGLLESGVMKADDFAALAEYYSENPTMLRLVALHARKGMYAAAGEPMRAERDALAGVVETCNRRLTAELDSFDRLTAKLSAEGLRNAKLKVTDGSFRSAGRRHRQGRDKGGAYRRCSGGKGYSRPAVCRV